MVRSFFDQLKRDLEAYQEFAQLFSRTFARAQKVGLIGNHQPIRPQSLDQDQDLRNLFKRGPDKSWVVFASSHRVVNERPELGPRPWSDNARLLRGWESIFFRNRNA